MYMDALLCSDVYSNEFLIWLIVISNIDYAIIFSELEAALDGMEAFVGWDRRIERILLNVS